MLTRDSRTTCPLVNVTSLSMFTSQIHRQNYTVYTAHDCVALFDVVSLHCLFTSAFKISFRWPSTRCQPAKLYQNVQLRSTSNVRHSWPLWSPHGG